MKNIILTSAILFFSLTIFSQNFGIDQPNPTQKLDVAGWIEVGNQSQGSAATAGALRYNTTVGKMQFYNGSIWVSMGSPSATFTRWGRDDCPTNSSLVYWGYAAGPRYNHAGSGTNQVCLTNDKAWTRTNDANHNGALFYGTEFQTSSNHISTLTNRHDYDARCAVCSVTDAAEAVMVPGTVTCPSGWTQQYWGYLMASAYSQQRSSFVCVDNAPDITGSNANHDGALWYPTEVEPGIMSATSYVIDREVTCVVCTK